MTYLLRPVHNQIPIRHSSFVMESGSAHRSEEHTSELQSRPHLVCRLLLEKKKKKKKTTKVLTKTKMITAPQNKTMTNSERTTKHRTTTKRQPTTVGKMVAHTVTQ